MATSQKAVNLAAVLASEIALRSDLLVTQGVDATTGNPTILVGAAAPGAAGAFLMVRPQSWPLAVDSLGLASPVYTPSVVQLCTEANPAGGAGADINTVAQLAQILLPATFLGARLEWYQSANGTVPSASQLTVANLQYAFDPGLYQGFVANQ